MLDFLNSRVWWVETIIGACISGCVALVVSYFMYLSKTNKVISRIEELSQQHNNLNPDDKGLSSEHGGLSRNHNAFSVGHQDLLKESRNISIAVALMSQTAVDTKIIVSEMNKAAEKERTAQQFRYDNLAEKQKSITENVIDTVKAFKALKDEFIRVNNKNNTLQSQMRAISEESKELKTLNSKLEQRYK